jgi:hypothetical protein
MGAGRARVRQVQEGGFEALRPSLRGVHGRRCSQVAAASVELFKE